jgi:hypothetical protein
MVVYPLDDFTHLGWHKNHIIIDTIAPVASFSPIEGSMGVSININPQVTFNEPIFKASDTTAFINGTDINAAFLFYPTYSPGSLIDFAAPIVGKTVTIMPLAPLAFDTDYSLVFTRNVQRFGSNLMQQIPLPSILFHQPIC